MLQKLQNAAPAAGILSSKSGFEQLESYQMLRANLLFSLPQEGCKLLITSAALGRKVHRMRQSGDDVCQNRQPHLLVDCDLRSPSLHRYLGLSGKLGLSSCWRYGKAGRMPACGANGKPKVASRGNPAAKSSRPAESPRCPPCWTGW
ncbi:MAG: hypothetical protein ACLSAP_07310 [Oscillospiraceae bacterium]